MVIVSDFFGFFGLTMVVVKEKEDCEEKRCAIILPRHYPQLKQCKCLEIQLEAFFHSRNTFSIALVLFLLLSMTLDFDSLLGLLPRPRCHF